MFGRKWWNDVEGPCLHSIRLSISGCFSVVSVAFVLGSDWRDKIRGANLPLLVQPPEKNHTCLICLILSHLTSSESTAIEF